MKTHPALASDLQTLCWGSTGVAGVAAALVQGPVVDAWGARTLYAFAIVPCGIVIVPALLGWMHEERLVMGCGAVIFTPPVCF
jgi:hypothetical protein